MLMEKSIGGVKHAGLFKVPFIDYGEHLEQRGRAASVIAGNIVPYLSYK